MATRLAILATAQAIQHLLAEAAAPTEFSDADISIAQAGDPPELGAPVTAGIRLYLYLVTADNTQRNTPARNAPAGGHARPPLPLELNFLLAPWSTRAITQLRLLGWAMRVLEDTPVLTATRLNAGFPGQAVFHADESVELIFNPLPLAEMARLWESLQPARVLPAATYVARPVVIDSDAEGADGA